MFKNVDGVGTPDSKFRPAHPSQKAYGLKPFCQTVFTPSQRS
jgi:hypothetical protein